MFQTTQEKKISDEYFKKGYVVFNIKEKKKLDGLKKKYFKLFKKKNFNK